MKKNLVSLLLVGALVAPGTIQVAQATGTGTGESHAPISEVENADGTITKTFETNYGATIVQVYEFNEETEDWIVVSQKETKDEVPAPKPAVTQYVGDPSLPFLQKVVGKEIEGVITVRVGTDESWTKQIPFETTVRSVATQEFDTRTESGGELGSKIVTQRYQVDPETGGLYNASLLEDQITKEAVDKVISVGNVNIDNVEIPFKTRYVVDTDLEKGKEEVLKKGIVGEKNVLTTYFINEDGTLGEVENVEEVMNFEPVTEVIAHNPVEDDLDSAKDLALKELAELNLSTEELAQYTKFIQESKTLEDVKGALASAKTVSEFNDNITNEIKDKYPELDNDEYVYERVRTKDKITVTIKDKEGNIVAVVEYIISTGEYVLLDNEETTEEETTEGESSQEESSEEDEESSVVEVITESGAVPVQVVRTDSRSELPETGELGGATAMMAAALSALGGLGLLFKKRK